MITYCVCYTNDSQSQSCNILRYNCFLENKSYTTNTTTENQVVIAQWLAQRLATGSKPSKGENLLISD